MHRKIKSAACVSRSMTLRGSCSVNNRDSSGENGSLKKPLSSDGSLLCNSDEHSDLTEALSSIFYRLGLGYIQPNVLVHGQWALLLLHCGAMVW
jgi:hypothetical protein